MPYDLSSTELYTISLVYQTIGLFVCANASVANETLIAGLMIQVGAQFEIFCHRVKNLSSLVTATRSNSLSDEEFKIRCRRILGDMVKHHLEIYEFADTVNSVFQYMIFLQFSISSVVLCLSIYKLSNIDPFSMNFVWSGSYLCCMLMQSKKVSDAIYEMDWMALPADLMKDLLLMLVRTKRPVKMTSGHVVILSVESFTTIMKMTYSSYNLLSNSTTK
ncbi:Odorant receptor Or1 [Melipona quadrifasciata]|uniref:Odorant receptor Or1 n=1 Tax=Melipona quadrifasciata TaxID=166423 RepID=A0A0N0BCQ3_9HYME|nr:Odorant receptor Or1 [Melipona quadrifasciata]